MAVPATEEDFAFLSLRHLVIVWNGKTAEPVIDETSLACNMTNDEGSLQTAIPF